jgi:2-polyprenyl-6-methoxyphenol hydroxylase-like FAD-dependent oxidoreductase
MDAGGAVREIRARITIGADGLHSLVAGTIGDRRPPALRRFGFAAT